MPMKEICKKYKITPKSVNEYVGATPITRTQIEEEFFRERLEAENIRITDLKTKFYDMIERTITDVDTLNIDEDNKSKVLAVLTKSIENMDKTIRLNRNMSTENQSTKNTTVKLDVAEVLKQLKTPEDKKKYLLEQASVIDVTE